MCVSGCISFQVMLYKPVKMPLEMKYNLKHTFFIMKSNSLPARKYAGFLNLLVGSCQEEDDHSLSPNPFCLSQGVVWGDPEVRGEREASWTMRG